MTDAYDALWRRTPSRPSEPDRERLARMRDRLGAELNLGLLQPLRWACGVARGTARLSGPGGG